ncbi:MAG: DEAD/DEAH box helicase, partial [Candidatus Kapaibacterium sp.]
MHVRESRVPDRLHLGGGIQLHGATSERDHGTRQAHVLAVREQVQLLLTNPDMLHLGILQYHQNQWASFFKNLKTVAIDECHEYRGIFGTNVSYILRRLRQVCKYHGSN